MRAISQGIGTGKTEFSHYSGYYGDELNYALKMNLKIKTSDAFKDGEPPEDAEDPEEAAKKLKFPWHCEKGIVENVRMLNIEFNETRGLNPVKIFVTGPPASGKTWHSDILASYYNIPRVDVK